MKYNPENTGNRKNYRNRRSIRLKGYDYSKEGLYFITICVKDREYRFGRIENGEMILNEFGTIAYNEWEKLPERFANFELDVFQIMPNHIHGIISLQNVGAGFTLAQNENVQPDPGQLYSGQPQGLVPTNVTVGQIVGAYKSLVANACLKIYKSKNETMRKLWQRNYYEHIIRNEQSYRAISNYISNNPAKWQNDTFYGKELL